MANNEEVQIKISTDTSDVKKGFKDVEKSADSMSKKIDKSADKVEKSFDDVEKTLKDVQKTMNTTFKNTNFNNFANSMKNAMQQVQRQVQTTANTIKSQLQKALNIQGNIDVKTTTTTDASSGSSSMMGNMMGELLGSKMTSGAIGSQIAKQMALVKENTEEVFKSASNLGKSYEDVVKEAKKFARQTDAYDKAKEQYEEIAQAVTDAGYEIDSFADVVRASMMRVYHSLQEASTDSRESIRTLVEAMDDLIETLGGNIDDKLVRGLIKYRDALNGVYKASRPRGVSRGDAPIAEAQIAKANKALKNTVWAYDEIFKAVDRINNMSQEDVATKMFGQAMILKDAGAYGDIANSLQQLIDKFKEAQTEVNVEPIIEGLKRLQATANGMGTSFDGIDEILEEYNRACAEGANLTNGFRNALVGVTRDAIKNVNAQQLQAQKMKELSQTTNKLQQAFISSKYGIKQFGSAIKSSLSDGALGKIKTTLTSIIKKTKEWAKSHISASKQIKNANKGMGSSFKSLLSTMLPFASIYGIFQGLKTSITSYADGLANSTRFATVFGNETQEMTEWLNSLNSSVTTTKSTLMDFSGNLFNMSKNMGMTVEDGKAFAQTMTELGADLEAFTGDANSIEALAGALRGEYDSLQNYGFMLSSASVQAKALAMGLDASSESSLALARQAIILEQANMGGVLGYASRHAQTLSGQIAMLKKNFQALGSAIGSCFAGLLQVVLPVLNAIVSAVTSAFNKLASIINSIFGLFGVKVGGVSSGGGAIGNAVGGITDSLGGGLGDAAGGAGDVADSLGSAADSAAAIQKSLMGIDEINNLSAPDNSSSGGSGGGSGGSGGGGGGGGLGGGLGDISFDLSETESVIDTLARELTGFEKAFLAIFQRIKMGFMAFADEIQSKWSKLKLNIQKLGQTLVEFLTSCWRNGLDDTAMLFGGLLGSITSTMLGIANIVVESATKLFEHLNPDNNEYTRKFIEAFNDMLLAVIQFVNQADGWLQTFMDNGGQDFLNNMADVCFIIGTTLIEAVEDAIEAIANFISEDDNKRVKDFAGACEGISEALKDIALWVQDNIGWLTTLGGVLVGIWAGMKLGKGVIKAVALAFEGWGWISGLFSTIGSVCSWLWTTILVPVGNAIMAGLTAIAAYFGVSVGVIAAAIAAAIAVIVLLVANWDWVCEKAGQLKDWVCEKWTQIKDWVVEKCIELKEKAIEKWTEIKEKVIELVTNLKDKIVEWWNKIKTSVIEKCTELKQQAKEKWEEIKTTIIDKVTQLKEKAVEKVKEIKEDIIEKFNELIQPIKDVWDGIWKHIEPIIEKLKNAFDFEWKLPELKLPKVNITKKVGLFGLEYPSFDVSWNAVGGIFDSPTIFNTARGLQGVGEKGAEAILPLDTLWQQMNRNFEKQTETLARMNNNNNQQTTLVLTLDGRELARGTFKNAGDLARLGQLNLEWL